MADSRPDSPGARAAMSDPLGRVGRKELIARLSSAERELSEVKAELAHRFWQVKDLQGRCTELLLEARALRASRAPCASVQSQ